ncbi:hypothetical protein [Phenylobacterium sp.]|uniref:relaxase/mobilization nuclease domain-containing protein n=1 Tax=Phenylobacterium sp. TaxID=1871053 RepID=UPI00272F1B72|nr:hypothetical protein [Phenylobacterium sp.]MDP1875183.1 hypothetical protein [Phenylobacterium sp.]
MTTLEFHPPKGFQDGLVERLENRRTPAEILSARAPLRPDQRAALWRLLANAPQAVVVVPPALKTPPHLRDHLNYITRAGALTLRDESDLPLKGAKQIDEMIEDWRCADRLDSRRRINSPIARQFVLGGPPGASPQSVEAAAALHLGRLHGPGHPFVRVTHTDTNHPHVHAVVRVLGRDRRRLTLYHQDLAIYRESYARALRDVGVDADASPRWMRGRPGRGPTAGHWRSRAHFVEHGGNAPRWMEAQYLYAAQFAFRADLPADDRELKVLASQGRLRRSFLDLASRLAKSPEDADRQLGLAIVDHVRALPPPETERMQLSRQMRTTHRGAERSDRAVAPTSPAHERRR